MQTSGTAVAEKANHKPASDALTPIGDRHRRVVRDQFVALHDIFDQSCPSTAISEIFRRTVQRAIDNRTQPGGPPVRVLEVGCGVGNWAEVLLNGDDRERPSIEYHGLDFAPNCVDSCNRRIDGRRGSRAMVADFEALEPDGSYDVVFFVEVFCHLKRRQDDAWLQRAGRWLAPGGSLVIIDKERYSRHGWRVRWDLLNRALLPAGWRCRPYYFPQQYNTLLTTLRYPHFRHLARGMNRNGLTAQPIVQHGLFSAVIGRAPAI